MNHVNELIRRMDALEKRQKDLEDKLRTLDNSVGSVNIQYVKPVEEKATKTKK